MARSRSFSELMRAAGLVDDKETRVVVTPNGHAILVGPEEELDLDELEGEPIIAARHSSRSFAMREVQYEGRFQIRAPGLERSIKARKARRRASALDDRELVEARARAFADIWRNTGRR